MRIIQVFGWTDSTLTLFTLWGTLGFPFFFFPSALLLRKSLRLSVVTRPDFFLPPESRFLAPFAWWWGRPSDVFLSYFQPLSPPSQPAAMLVKICDASVSEVPFRIHFQRYRRSDCHGSPYSDISSLVSSPCKFSPISFSKKAFLQERTRATSIGQMFNALGVRGRFVVRFPIPIFQK